MFSYKIFYNIFYATNCNKSVNLHIISIHFQIKPNRLQNVVPYTEESKEIRFYKTAMKIHNDGWKI